MNESAGYAVFFFAPALEALGEAIKPYLKEGPAGPHVPCREVDTAGAFIEMTLEGRAPDGREVSLELMVPGNMVRMIVSARSTEEFGFYDRSKPAIAVQPVKPVAPADEPGESPAEPPAEAPATAPDAPAP